MICSCGCGRELPKSRSKWSKYIKGHYSKMCKGNHTERQFLLAERKKIRNNKKFMKMYKRLKQIDRALNKLVKHRSEREYDMSILWR